MWRRGVTAFRWLEAHPVKALLVFSALAVLLRAPFVDWPLESDEGGFLMVARQWDGPGVSLYTDQWVDRPPLLLLVFKFADAVGGSAAAIRILAIGFAVATVASAWWAGRIINGRRGAIAAGLVAAAVGSMFAIDGYSLTGECIAGAFVMTSCAMLLQARYGASAQQRALALAFGAGIVGACAVLTKQNFIDAGVFAAALLLTQLRTTWRLLVAFAAGAVVPLAATAVWAESDSGPGLRPLWVALFAFRRRSIDVISDASTAAPIERLKWLAVLFVATGLLLLVVRLLVAARRAEGRPSLRMALVAVLGYDLLSILAGASWWTHYLLQLTPVLAMGAALATERSVGLARTRLVLAYVTAAAVVSTLVGIALGVGGLAKNHVERDVAQYLGEAAEPSDSVVLAYGSPEVIAQSGLTTPYPYAWSLPLRTRDPQLNQLVSVLEGPDAPAWLVEIGDFDWWGIDTPAFEAVRADRYRLVSAVCGRDIYLRSDLERPLPPPPDC